MTSLCFLQIEVWREPSLSLQRPTPTKWWPYGTAPPTCSWAPLSTPHPSTCGKWRQTHCSHAPFFPLACCAFLHVAPCLCSGVWAASFMKWSPGGLFSLGRLWRTSFTSYSASWVRRRSRLMPRLRLCYFAVCSTFAWEHRGRVPVRAPSFHLQMCDRQVLPRKSRGPASPPVRSLKPTISLNTKLSLLSATHPGTSLNFLFLTPTRILNMHLRILFRINKHNLTVLFFHLAPFSLSWFGHRIDNDGLDLLSMLLQVTNKIFFLCRIVFC